MPSAEITAGTESHAILLTRGDWQLTVVGDDETHRIEYSLTPSDTWRTLPDADGEPMNRSAIGPQLIYTTAGGYVRLVGSVGQVLHADKVR